MKKLLLGAVALMFSVVLATPVWAGCAEDIKTTEKNKENLNDRNEGARNAVDRMLAKAKQALADGNMKKCATMVSKAQAKIDSSI